MFELFRVKRLIVAVIFRFVHTLPVDDDGTCAEALSGMPRMPSAAVVALSLPPFARSALLSAGISSVADLEGLDAGRLAAGRCNLLPAMPPLTALCCSARSTKNWACCCCIAITLLSRVSTLVLQLQGCPWMSRTRCCCLRSGVLAPAGACQGRTVLLSWPPLRQHRRLTGQELRAVATSALVVSPWMLYWAVVV